MSTSEEIQKSKMENFFRKVFVIGVIVGLFVVAHSMSEVSQRIDDLSAKINEVSSNEQNMEIEKLGGEENYNLFKQLVNSSTYKSQQKQALEMAIKQMQTPMTDETYKNLTTNLTPNTGASISNGTGSHK